MSMTDRVAIRRLATGVPGLDQVLGGGLPEFSFNLIAGAPGTGKTTLAHQVVVDSFRTVVRAAGRAQHGDFNLQYFVQELAVRLAGWQATTFLVGEYQRSELERNPVSTVADGL